MMPNIKIKLPFSLEELEMVGDALSSYHEDCSEGLRKVIDEVRGRVEKGKGMIEEAMKR